MSSTTVGQHERKTQQRVVRLLREQLGYGYLGNREDRANNSNIEEDILRAWLNRTKGYSEALISKALYELGKAANDLSDGLYSANQKVYDYLRYGVKVKADASDNHETVELIDWNHPLRNEFAIAEEVTISGNNDKQPDIVIYVNGIALGVLELKRSIVSIGDGIRQNITNQRPEFIEAFFATIQWIFAGNDTQGSGKSLVMVWLAKWILEHNSNARIVIITDRDELDKQIERVFNEAGEGMVRTQSGNDLMDQLGKPLPRMLCSLVHKFGRRDADDFDKFIEELKISFSSSRRVVCFCG